MAKVRTVRLWTLVDARGNILVDRQFHEPFIWKRKCDAEDCREDDAKVVRATLVVEDSSHD